jgi:hypothetical protein
MIIYAVSRGPANIPQRKVRLLIALQVRGGGMELADARVHEHERLAVR